MSCGAPILLLPNKSGKEYSSLLPFQPPPGERWNIAWTFERESSLFLTKSDCRPLFYNHIQDISIPYKGNLPLLSKWMREKCLLPQCISSLQKKGGYVAKSVRHGNVEMETRGGSGKVYQEKVSAMTLPNTKRVFDVGVYVLLVAEKQVRYRIHEEWLIRVSKEDCSPPFTKLSCIVTSDYLPVHAFPSMRSHLSSCNSSAGCAVRRTLKRSTFVWEEMKRVIRCSIQFEERTRSLLPCVPPLICFELLRFDFLLNGSNEYPYLTEVNESPSLVSKYKENDMALKNEVIQSTFSFLLSNTTRRGEAV